MKLLIDECLHTILVSVAHSAGHSADHVSHRGLGELKDWELMRVIREQEYTFVTNNGSDFLGLHGKNRSTLASSSSFPTLFQCSSASFSRQH